MKGSNRAATDVKHNGVNEKASSAGQVCVGLMAFSQAVTQILHSAIKSEMSHISTHKAKLQDQKTLMC